MKFTINEDRFNSIINNYIETLIGNLTEFTFKNGYDTFFLKDDGVPIFKYYDGRLQISNNLFDSLKKMFNFTDESVSSLKLAYILIDYFEKKFPQYKITKGWSSNLHY